LRHVEYCHLLEFYRVVVNARRGEFDYLRPGNKAAAYRCGEITILFLPDKKTPL
jgi:hypothetical protein